MTGIDDVDDYKSTGSVLEKLSLFEKLEQRQAASTAAAAAAVANAAALAKSNSITSSTGAINETSASPVSNVRRNDDLSKSIRSIDKDPGMQSNFTHFLFVFTNQHAFKHAQAK